jgi:hypothetical protein
MPNSLENRLFKAVGLFIMLFHGANDDKIFGDFVNKTVFTVDAA